MKFMTLRGENEVKRKGLIALVASIALVALVLCGCGPATTPTPSATATPTPTATATPSVITISPTTMLPTSTPTTTTTQIPTASPTVESLLFEGGGFSFLYPSNWQRMTEKDIDHLWETELRGSSILLRQNVVWLEGFFWGQVDPSNHANSANMYAWITSVQGMPGPMSEADYDDYFNRLKANYESTMGERLYSIQKIMCGDFQAIEVVNLGKSLNQVLYGICVFAEPNYVYSFNCGLSKNAEESLKTIIEEAVASLKVSVTN